MSECEEVDCTIYPHYHWVLALSLGLPGHVLVEVPHCLLLLVVQQDMSTTFHDLHSQLRTAVLQVHQLVHEIAAHQGGTTVPMYLPYSLHRRCPGWSWGCLI